MIDLPVPARRPGIVLNVGGVARIHEVRFLLYVAWGPAVSIHSSNRNTGRPGFRTCRTPLRCFAIEVCVLYQREIRRSPCLSYPYTYRKILKAHDERERIAVASSQPGSAYVGFGQIVKKNLLGPG